MEHHATPLLFADQVANNRPSPPRTLSTKPGGMCRIDRLDHCSFPRFRLDRAPTVALSDSRCPGSSASFHETYCKDAAGIRLPPPWQGAMRHRTLRLERFYFNHVNATQGFTWHRGPSQWRTFPVATQMGVSPPHPPPMSSRWRGCVRWSTRCRRLLLSLAQAKAGRSASLRACRNGPLMIARTNTGSPCGESNRSRAGLVGTGWWGRGVVQTTSCRRGGGGATVQGTSANVWP